MGQYHQVWAFDPTKTAPAETIGCYALGVGAKLGEQCYTGSPYCAAIALMVMGPWAGRRITVIGDYAEDDDINGFDEALALTAYYGNASRDPLDANDNADPTIAVNRTDLALQLLAEASGITFTPATYGRADVVEPADIAARTARWTEMGDRTEPHLIVSSAGEYIRPERLASPNHPLAMPFIGAAWAGAVALTGCSDGRGGGDFSFEPAGRWAYTALAVIAERNVDTARYSDVTDLLLANRWFSDWAMGGLADD